MMMTKTEQLIRAEDSNKKVLEAEIKYLKEVVDIKLNDLNTPLPDDTDVYSMVAEGNYGGLNRHGQATLTGALGEVEEIARLLNKRVNKLHEVANLMRDIIRLEQTKIKGDI